MPSILRHRLPSNYRLARITELLNSCNRAKMFVMFTVQSIWLTDCLQQLHNTVPRYRMASEPHQIIIISVTSRWQVHVQIGFLSNCNCTNTQTVQAKHPEKAEKFPLVTKCVTIASSRRRSLWMQMADPPAFSLSGIKVPKNRHRGANT